MVGCRRRFVQQHLFAPKVITSTNMTTTIDLHACRDTITPTTTSFGDAGYVKRPVKIYAPVVRALPRKATPNSSSHTKRTVNTRNWHSCPCAYQKPTCASLMLLRVSLSCSSASEIESAISVPKDAQFSDSEHAATMGVGYSNIISFTELTEGLS